MTTATTVSTSTASTGITWKVLAGGSDINAARVKITFGGISKEYNMPSNVDPIADPVLWAVKAEMLANGSANTQREGTVSITAASTTVRLVSGSDYVAL